MTPGNLTTPPRRFTLTDLPIELKCLIIKIRRWQAERDDPKFGNWRPAIADMGLISKDMAELCQQEIFRQIDMEPQSYTIGNTTYRGSNTMTVIPGIMKASPHLAQHVKHLYFTFPFDPEDISTQLADDVTSTLRMFTNVTTLNIKWEDPWNWDRTRRTSTVRLDSLRNGNQLCDLVDALVDIAKRRKMERLCLTNVALSPRDTMAFTGLKNLVFEPSDCLDAIFANPKDMVGEHPIFLEDLQIFAHKPQEYVALDTDISLQCHPWFNMSRLRKVVVERQDMALQTVLRKAENLRVLVIITPQHQDPSQVHQTCPFAALNPAAFSTLQYLKISLAFDLDTLRGSIRNLIPDPYQGLTSDGVLVRLTELRSLWVEIRMKAYHRLCENEDTTTESFGDQWGVLDRALVPLDAPRPLAQLRCVVLIVMANGGEDDESDDESNEDEDEREKVHTQVRKRVFNRQFPRLMELQAKAGLEITFLNKVPPSRR